MPANSFATSLIGPQVKLVGGAVLGFARHGLSDRPGQHEHDRVAHQVLAARPATPATVEGDAGLPARGRSRIAAITPPSSEQVDLAARACTSRSGVGSLSVGNALLARRVEPAVERRRTSPARCATRGSVSGSRCVVVQKKSTPRRKPRKSGGSPERRQRAADVRDQEDEEHDDMRRCARRLSLARMHRADHDHRGAGGADDGWPAACRSPAGPVFVSRRAVDVAA